MDNRICTVLEWTLGLKRLAYSRIYLSLCCSVTLPKQNNEISMISDWKNPREIIGFSLSEVPGVNENFMKTRNFMKWKSMKNEKPMNIFHGVFIVS